MWILYAVGSSFFAGITAILAKCGIQPSDVTAIRTKATSSEDNQYIIHSMKKSHKRQYTYDEIIKEFILFADADAEEIGKAVI